VLKRFFPSNLKRRRKINPTVLVEAMLDLVLITGFLAAVGFLISIATRLVFWPWETWTLTPLLSCLPSPAQSASLTTTPSMLKALDRLLSSAGLQAQLFSEPLRFLSYVSYNFVALAILDIWMAEMSGL
jgi:hypothetical protein